MKTCVIEGCTQRNDSLGWCKSHYARWRRHGDPMAGRQRYDSPEEAFAARTMRKNGCLVWTGSKDSKGYGGLFVDGKMMPAHRYAWQRTNGAIPQGFEVDHMCWNHACCAVEHLRLATRNQNMWNQNGASRDNKSTGIRNVYRKGSRFAVVIHHKGTRHYLGTYPTLEAANSAAEVKRHELFGAFAGRGAR